MGQKAFLIYVLGRGFATENPTDKDPDLSIWKVLARSRMFHGMCRKVPEDTSKCRKDWRRIERARIFRKVPEGSGMLWKILANGGMFWKDSLPPDAGSC